MLFWWSIVLVLVSVCSFAGAQETHNHAVPEKLGEVSFPISCKPAVQAEFNRGVALLHSFAYSAAEQAFQQVAAQDAQCAMAQWGIAMAHFRQLWDPAILPESISTAQKAVATAQRIGGGSERERQFVNAIAMVYQDAATVPYATRAANYERAMSQLAAANKDELESQVFYALALLANASPTDKSHSHQKQAAEILEPLDIRYPQHPGIPHYLIHAYDNTELASQGLRAARAYAQIAPSAPHALHMPSHIFTRLGLWEDSIASNLAAKDAAHTQKDLGEELHSMDYLVYAYLQSGREKEAAGIVEQVKAMQRLNASDFKVGYASVAMPVRYAVERGHWEEAAQITPPPGPPHIVAIAVWARGIGLARSGHAADARVQSGRLQQTAEQLRASGNNYWATQTEVLAREVEAWGAQADRNPDKAVSLMRAAADEEDAIEKLPMTPGPIVPAREQLGEMLLEQNQPSEAAKEFASALKLAPGRRGAMQGAARANELLSRK